MEEDLERQRKFLEAQINVPTGAKKITVIKSSTSIPKPFSYDDVLEGMGGAMGEEGGEGEEEPPQLEAKKLKDIVASVSEDSVAPMFTSGTKDFSVSSSTGFPLPFKCTDDDATKARSIDSNSGGKKRVSLFKASKLSQRGETALPPATPSVVVNRNVDQVSLPSAVPEVNEARREAQTMFDNMTHEEKEAARNELLASLSPELLAAFQHIKSKKVKSIDTSSGSVASESKKSETDSLERVDVAAAARSGNSMLYPMRRDDSNGPMGATGSAGDGSANIGVSGVVDSKEGTLYQYSKSNPPTTDEELAAAIYTLPEEEQRKLDWIYKRGEEGSTTANSTEPSQMRFDLKGHVIHDISSAAAMSGGLYHHEAEPDKPGYTMDELLYLSRSNFVSQRAYALHAISGVLLNRNRAHRDGLPLFPETLPPEIYITLRTAIDSSNLTILAPALKALKHLLVPENFCNEDLSILVNYRNYESIPFQIPHCQEEDTVDGESREEKIKLIESDSEVSDQEICVIDAVYGFLRMGLFPRLRYILEVLKPNSVECITAILDLLCYCSTHCMSTAVEVINTPRLLNCIRAQFIEVGTPYSKDTIDPASTDIYKIAYPAALRLVRIFCSVGRHVCLSLMEVGLLDSIKRWLPLTGDYSQSAVFDGTFNAMEVLQLESLLIWRVAMAYGLDCEIFGAMYSVVSKWLKPTSVTTHPVLYRATYNVFEALVYVGYAATVEDPDNIIKEYGVSITAAQALSALQSNVFHLLPRCSDREKVNAMRCGGGVLHFLAAMLNADATVTPFYNLDPAASLTRISDIVRDIMVPMSRTSLFAVALQFCSIPSSEITIANSELVITAQDWMLGYIRCLSNAIRWCKQLLQKDEVTAILNQLSCIFTFESIEGSFASKTPSQIYLMRGRVWAQYYLLMTTHQLHLAQNNSAGLKAAHDHALNLSYCLVPGDEHLLQELYSRVIFSIPSLQAACNVDEQAAFKLRTCLLPFFRNGIAPMKACTCSQILSCHNIDQIAHISIERGSTHSILPLPRDWLFLPLLNASEEKQEIVGEDGVPTSFEIKKPLVNLETLVCIMKLLYGLGTDAQSSFMHTLPVGRKLFLILNVFFAPYDTMCDTELLVN
jgi:hypothetical protein